MNTHERTTLNLAARYGRRRQAGATLIVGLILLLVLTMLGVSGMNTATLEVQMARNTQLQQEAFQAAETGIDLSISLPNPPGFAPQPVPLTPLGGGLYNAQAIKNCVFAQAGAPDAAYSPSVAKSWFFEIVAVGSGPQNARSTHTQSFYKMGPFNTSTCP
jgi:type IV pilus assembly protein PilX